MVVPGRADLVQSGPELVRLCPRVEQIQVQVHGLQVGVGGGNPAPTDGREDSVGGADRAVADGYDAMTTDRPYRKRMSSHVALGILQEHAGYKWDAESVAALGSVLRSESSDGDLSLVMILCPTAVCDRGKAGCAAGIYGEWTPLVPRKQWPSGAARIRRESGIISSTERI